MTLSWLSLPFNCLHSPYLVIFLILISTFSSQNFIFLLFWLIHPVSLLGPIYRPKWRIPWTWKASSGPAHLQSLYMRYAFVLNISGWAGPLSKLYSPRMCPFNYENHVHWSNVPKNDSKCPVQRRSDSFGPGPWVPSIAKGIEGAFCSPCSSTGEREFASITNRCVRGTWDFQNFHCFEYKAPPELKAKTKNQHELFAGDSSMSRLATHSHRKGDLPFWNTAILFSFFLFYFFLL